jgi:hypothetical protein
MLSTVFVVIKTIVQPHKLNKNAGVEKLDRLQIRKVKHADPAY